MSRLLIVEAWSPAQIQLSYCPWEVSPPDGGGLSPVQVSRRRNIYLNVNCGIQFLYEDMYIHLKLRSQEEKK
jgi:hypothetical protein